MYRALWWVRVEGLEHVPADGPAIIAANHVSFFDSVAIIMAIRRPVSFVGKAEYLDSWKTRRLLPALGMIPVDRQSGRQAMSALQIAAGVLSRSGLFAIYPEGTRSRDGALAPGHTGVAHIAVASGAPIIPTGISGTAEIQPPDTRFPRPFRRAVVRFGRPIDPGGYRGGRRTRRRLITDDVMSAIQQLSGQQRRGLRPPAGPHALTQPFWSGTTPGGTTDQRLCAAPTPRPATLRPARWPARRWRRGGRTSRGRRRPEGWTPSTGTAWGRACGTAGR